ncbi:MAG: hypothetical protein WCH04_14930 [Gammaproteobacteria bacterium]
MTDENRAILVKRLGLLAVDAQYWKDGKIFKAPPGKKAASTQLKKLTTTLRNVRTAIDDKDDRVFRAVNRSLFEGDIPLLDFVQSHAGGGRTDAPRRIAEVLYELSERLSEHIGTFGGRKERRAVR